MIMEDEELKNYLINKAFFYLKFRPRTEKEVFDYLQKKLKKIRGKEISSKDRECLFEVINFLKSNNYLNDRDFIDWFVTQRIRTKPRGIAYLKYELERMGVSKQLVKDYFISNSINEEEIIKSNLPKLERRYRSLEVKKRKQKITQYLQRKGFNFWLINKVIKSDG